MTGFFIALLFVFPAAFMLGACVIYIHDQHEDDTTQE